MVEIAMFNVQRAITPKIGKPELRFMCSVCRIIMLYICVKFCENTSDGISYGADTNDGSADIRTFTWMDIFCILQCKFFGSKYPTRPQNTQVPQIGYFFDTNRINGKYLIHVYPIYAHSWARTNGWTLRKFGGYGNIIPSPLFMAGHNDNTYSK